MFIFKVLSILSLAFLAKGSDRDTALSMMACAQKAIVNGVPEIPVPSHTPVLVTRNFSWTGDITVATASLLFHNISWAGIPDWDVDGYQISNDSDPFAVFDFKIHWDWMEVNGSIDATFTQLALKEKFNGSINTVWKDIAWTGRINVTKRGNDLPAQVNDFQVLWTIGDSSTKAEGFGIFGSPLSLAMDWLLPAGVSSSTFSAAMSDTLKGRLNSFWWSTGNIWKLLEWCVRN